jgi:hypothetical protein
MNVECTGTVVSLQWYIWLGVGGLNGNCNCNSQLIPMISFGDVQGEMLEVSRFLFLSFLFTLNI